MSAKDPVLLGFIDLPIPVTDKGNFQVSKIGGTPDWMYVEKGVTCRLCSRNSTLVLQIYCPLGQSSYHRTLYLFCCLNRSCWNNSESWTALRCQQRVQTDPKLGSESANEKSQGSSSWLGDQDDWDQDGDIHPENISDDALCSATENLALPPSPLPTIIHSSQTAMDDDSNDSTTPSQVIPEALPVTFSGELPWKTHTQVTQTLSRKLVLCPFYLSVSEESSHEMDSSEHVDNLLQDYQQHAGNPFYKVRSSPAAVESSPGMESYEQTEVKHGDKCFYKFQKMLSRLPQQVIRYQWGGKPLLIQPQEGRLPSCQSCGAQRVFEFQLMPTLVPSLKIQDHETNGNDPPVEFGTVLVSSCTNSCWEDNDAAKLEHVLVQSDPDENLFQV